MTTHPDDAMTRERADKFWLELREPKCIPERKGPWPRERKAEILREFMDARQTAQISVVTWTYDGPHFQDAPECLSMLDGRSMRRACRHIESSNRARASAQQEPVPPAAFHVGDAVIKSSGYDFPGIVRAAFTTSSGVVRYVVEHSASAGLLHIFNEGQLAPAQKGGLAG